MIDRKFIIRSYLLYKFKLDIGPSSASRKLCKRKHHWLLSGDPLSQTSKEPLFKKIFCSVFGGRVKK